MVCQSRLGLTGCDCTIYDSHQLFEGLDMAVAQGCNWQAGLVMEIGGYGQCWQCQQGCSPWKRQLALGPCWAARQWCWQCAELVCHYPRPCNSSTSSALGKDTSHQHHGAPNCSGHCLFVNDDIGAWLCKWGAVEMQWTMKLHPG